MKSIMESDMNVGLTGAERIKRSENCLILTMKTAAMKVVTRAGTLLIQNANHLVHYLMMITNKATNGK